MHSPSLAIPLRARALWLAAALVAWRAAVQQLRTQHAQARSLRRAERDLAAMSLCGLRDIGAPEALLQRRQRADERARLLRDGMHLRG